MNKNTTAWFCHGCHKKGTAVDFAADLKGISPLKAIQLLREKYDPNYLGSGLTSTSDEVRRILTSKPQPQEERQPVLAEDDLERFYDIPPQAWEYLLGRGFTEETLNTWEIGYDSHSKRITIPIRDERNNLIGFKGRTYIDAKPKYLVLGDRPGRQPYYGFSTYSVGRVVFGLPHAILANDPYLEDSPRRFVVCEGELNAIAMWQAGHAGIAIQGSNLTRYQSEVIKREADELVLFFDDDEAGRRALGHALKEFEDHMPVKVVLSDKDAAACSDEEIEDLIKNAESGMKYLLSSSRA